MTLNHKDDDDDDDDDLLMRAGEVIIDFVK